MGDFKRLRAWHLAHALAVDLYRRTAEYPPAERFGLIDQIRRAAISIGANLAEGCGRCSDREFRRYARIARGSAFELEYHLRLSKDLGLLAEAEWAQLDDRIHHVQGMLTRLCAAGPPVR